MYSSLFQAMRVIALVASLLLAACAPMALPDSGAISVPPASQSSADDDGATPNPIGVPGSEVEFTGSLTMIDGKVWTVNGTRVLVSAQTEIQGGLQIGGLVKVHGTLQADGSVLAREIRAVTQATATVTATPLPTGTSPVTNTVTATPGAHAEIEFVGSVTAINGNVWTVNGLSVHVTAHTEIEGHPQVGHVVKVEGTLQGDGSVLAREIEALRPAADTPTPALGHEVEFSGALTAINGSTYVINGIVVLITANTEVKDTLAVGDVVKVHGRLQADGTVIAREIEKDDERDVEDEDRDDDRSGSHPGSDDDDDRDDDNSGNRDDDDDDNSGRGGGDDDDDDDDDRGGGDD